MKMAGWLAYWLAGLLADWLIGWLAYWLDGGLTIWSIHCISHLGRFLWLFLKSKVSLQDNDIEYTQVCEHIAHNKDFKNQS